MSWSAVSGKLPIKLAAAGKPSHSTMPPLHLPSCQGPRSHPQFKAESHTFHTSRQAAWSMPKGPCWEGKADRARVLLPAQRHQEGEMALQGTDGDPACLASGAPSLQEVLAQWCLF